MTDKWLWGDGESISESEQNRPKSNIQFCRRAGGVWNFNWGGMFDSQYGAASFFIKLPQLLMNTEKPVWEDKCQPILAHLPLLSELSVIRKKSLISL